LATTDIKLISFDTNIENVKNFFQKEVLKIITKLYSSYDYVNLIQFILINNKLCSNNVFITDSNYSTFTTNLITANELTFIKEVYPRLIQYNKYLEAYDLFNTDYAVQTTASDVQAQFKIFLNSIA